ncbi:MAG: flagellar basal-body MS-ring/collar protein FliF [Candidatus Coatesbacteria bacterium]
MSEYLRQMLERFRELWGRLTPLQKAVVTVVPVVLFVVLAFLLAAVSRPPEAYGVLFAELPREDASAIVSRLKSAGVPYRLKDDGATIEVPIKDVYDLRLSVASAGLPKGPGVGFELFDKTQVLGTTDAQQRVAWQRALQGELTRTIMSLSEIRSAKVNLALPQPSLYSDKAQDATASVLLDLKRGYKLEPGQVRGIIHLVAMGVEGLKPQNVKVVDVFGNVLSDLVRDELLEEANPEATTSQLSRQAKLAQGQLAVQAAVERDLERRVRDILTKVLGEGRAEVKVTAELNFDQVRSTSKSFEPVVGPVGIARSTQHKTETYTGVGGIPGGVPGVESNIPGYQAVVGGNLSYAKNEDTRNYEINEKVEEVIKAPGAIKRLSIAVFVDNVQVQQKTAIERAVAAAVGLDPVRGDQVAVENLPFDKTLMDQIAAERSAVDRKEQEQVWLDVAKFGTIVGVVLLTLVFVRALVRPRIVRERVLVEVAGAPIVEEVAPAAPPPPPPPPPPSEEIAPPPPLLMEPEPTAALERQRRQQIRQHVTRMARQRPEMIASIIKRWILEEKR